MTRKTLLRPRHCSTIIFLIGSLVVGLECWVDDCSVATESKVIRAPTRRTVSERRLSRLSSGILPDGVITLQFRRVPGRRLRICCRVISVAIGCVVERADIDYADECETSESGGRCRVSACIWVQRCRLHLGERKCHRQRKTASPTPSSQRKCNGLIARCVNTPRARTGHWDLGNALSQYQSSAAWNVGCRYTRVFQCGASGTRSMCHRQK